MSEQLSHFLGSDLLKLINDGEKLLTLNTSDFYDYSFALFPFAKAYEGYLKKLFFNMGAITQNQYESDHWRVGKALNPQLEKEISHDESVYDRIVEHCGSVNPHSDNPAAGNDLADKFWEAWKVGRNQIFHFYPQHYKALTLSEAIQIRQQILEVMEQGLMVCKI